MHVLNIKIILVKNKVKKDGSKCMNEKEEWAIKNPFNSMDTFISKIIIFLNEAVF